MTATQTKPENPKTWPIYQRLLRYAYPYVPRLIAGLLFGLLFALCNGGLVWVIRGGFREVFNPEHMSLVSVTAVALFFPLVGLVRGITDFLARYCIRWVGNRVVMDLRNEMFGHIHELSVSYFSKSRTGELISRVSNDTMLIERAVSTVLSDLVKQPPTLVAMIVWVFIVDAKLALVSLVVFPVCILPIAAFGRKVRRYSRQSQEKIADFISILQETVSGVRIVKAFGTEKYETKRFVEQSRAFFGRIMRVTKASIIVEPIVVFIATVGVAVVLIYVRAVEMKIHDFVTFAAALFMMYEPIKKLSKVHMYIQQSSAAVDRIFEVLDTRSTVKERSDAVDFSEDIRGLFFENVSFSYGEELVLKNITFSVRTGERIAIVGGSGVGKTTLVNLLPRFFDVTNGKILLNDIDIRDMTLKSLRSQIGLVTQETFLFNDTVANNISYGASNATRESIEKAAQRAYAHEFIMKMPDGYETIVGERGVRLSGGQRQRLSIARAVLRNPPILILDEATSALDTESERMVQAALNELITGRTVFAIAHRLSTIANCDKIIVLDKGRIVEHGTHEDLYNAGGRYRSLCNMQVLNENTK